MITVDSYKPLFAWTSTDGSVSGFADDDNIYKDMNGNGKLDVSDSIIAKVSSAKGGWREVDDSTTSGTWAYNNSSGVLSVSAAGRALGTVPIAASALANGSAEKFPGVLGGVDPSSADLVTGIWSDDSTNTPGSGVWSVTAGAKLVSGFYRPAGKSSEAQMANIFVDSNRNGRFDESSDQFVGVAQVVSSTGGSGKWNWSSSAPGDSSGAPKGMGDFFDIKGNDVGKFYLIDTSFLL